MAGAQFDGDFSQVQGNWVDGELVEGNSQGLTFDYISTSDVLFVAWYTYQSVASIPAFDDVSAIDGRWLTAQLSITPDGTSAAGTIYASSGGEFDSPNNGSQETVAVGTMTIEFIECDLGMVIYELDSGLSGDFGIIPLEKRVNPGRFECETRQTPDQGPADEFNLLAVTDPDLIDLATEVQDIEFGSWSTIPAFYPNQASYQWIGGRSVNRTNPQVGHFGGDVISTGAACVQCHADYVPDSLSNPDVGESFDPGFDKPSQVDMKVRAAFTSDKLFVHVRHQSNTDAQGQNADDKQEGPAYTHQTYRFNGEGFGDRGIPKESGPDGAFTGTYDTLGNRRFNYEDRVALMMAPAALDLTDQNGARFNAAGCFMACHDDMRNMPADGLEDISADPVLGAAGMGRSDMRHYLLTSRANVTSTSDLFTLSFAESTFEAYKSNVILPEIEAGRYLDMWQGRIARAAGMGHATDDYVQAYRRDNNAEVSEFAGWAESGQNTFFTQDPDPERGNLMPYIYDPQKTGFWAIPENQFAAFMRAEFLQNNAGVMISEGPDRNVINLEEDGIFEWDEAA
ncbi:MAG: ethylbenzene dehydrogenase-related protein, partial [Wenzhouxiangellaceae bacterium]